MASEEDEVFTIRDAVEAETQLHIFHHNVRGALGDRRAIKLGDDEIHGLQGDRFRIHDDIKFEAAFDWLSNAVS